MKLLVLLTAACVLSACATPDLTGLSKDERKFVLKNAEERRRAWRAVGIGAINFGLQFGANSLNQRGFEK